MRWERQAPAAAAAVYFLITVLLFVFPPCCQLSLRYSPWYMYREGVFIQRAGARQLQPLRCTGGGKLGPKGAEKRAEKGTQMAWEQTKSNGQAADCSLDGTGGSRALNKPTTEGRWYSSGVAGQGSAGDGRHGCGWLWRQ